MSEIKLSIELVPRTAWFSNLRSALSTKQWDIVRRSAYAKSNHKCSICGGVGVNHPVEAHEIWSYDDDLYSQTLFDVIALCPACHEVKHYGLACNRDREEQAFLRLMLVNKWDRQTALDYVKNVFSLWEIRSKNCWSINIDWLYQNHNISIAALLDRCSNLSPDF